MPVYRQCPIRLVFLKYWGWNMTRRIICSCTLWVRMSPELSARLLPLVFCWDSSGKSFVLYLNAVCKLVLHTRIFVSWDTYIFSSSGRRMRSFPITVFPLFCDFHPIDTDTDENHSADLFPAESVLSYGKRND